MLSLLLIVIISAQIMPGFVMEYLSDTLQWQLWHIATLSVVVLQSTYIFSTIPRGCVIKKSMSFIGLTAGMFFLFDYVAPNVVEENIGQVVRFVGEYLGNAR